MPPPYICRPCYIGPWSALVNFRVRFPGRCPLILLHAILGTYNLTMIAECIRTTCVSFVCLRPGPTTSHYPRCLVISARPESVRWRLARFRCPSPPWSGVVRSGVTPTSLQKPKSVVYSLCCSSLCSAKRRQTSGNHNRLCVTDRVPWRISFRNGICMKVVVSFYETIIRASYGVCLAQIYRFW